MNGSVASIAAILTIIFTLYLLTGVCSRVFSIPEYLRSGNQQSRYSLILTPFLVILGTVFFGETPERGYLFFVAKHGAMTYTSLVLMVAALLWIRSRMPEEWSGLRTGDMSTLRSSRAKWLATVFVVVWIASLAVIDRLFTA